MQAKNTVDNDVIDAIMWMWSKGVSAMYVDVNGNEFDSYEAACYYYGADTPAQIEADERAYALEEHEDWCLMHAMWMDMADVVHLAAVDIFDEIPF